VDEVLNEIKVTSILNKHKKRDDWFLGDYTLNSYAGCPFNCIYCYTRGSKYGGDHGSEVALKANAVFMLKRQLKNRIRRAERGFIVVGSAAEAYPPIERNLGITREILFLIKRYKFPVHVCTKSSLILRDLDVLEEINRDAILPDDLKEKLGCGVLISFSFSTLDEELASILEPGAPSPMERLETMKKCSDAGFKVGIINMPVLPFLSDSSEDLEAMIKSAKIHGAEYIIFAGLTLYGDGPDDCRTLYYQFLENHFPELVLGYKKLFFSSFAPSKRYQMDLTKRYHEISTKYGVKNRII
jgi:DNA repair photolyase